MPRFPKGLKRWLLTENGHKSQSVFTHNPWLYMSFHPLLVEDPYKEKQIKAKVLKMAAQRPVLILLLGSCSFDLQNDTLVFRFTKHMFHVVTPT